MILIVFDSFLKSFFAGWKLHDLCRTCADGSYFDCAAEYLRLPQHHEFNNRPWEYVRAKSQLSPPEMTTMAQELYDAYIQGDDGKLDFNAKSFVKTRQK